jgi:hypothetical protein
LLGGGAGHNRDALNAHFLLNQLCGPYFPCRGKYPKQALSRGNKDLFSSMHDTLPVLFQCNF